MSQAETSLRPPAAPLTAILESLLFVADGPVSAGRLAEVLETTVEVVLALLRELEAGYQPAADGSRSGRGLCLQWSGTDTVQLTTVPAAASAIERFLGLEETARLSPAALEALALVAYQQPVTRPQIDSVRGVNSDAVLRTLVGRGLIEEVGRADAPGRPILYATTPAFLQHFGLARLGELPPLVGPMAEAQPDDGGSSAPEPDPGEASD